MRPNSFELCTSCPGTSSPTHSCYHACGIYLCKMTTAGNVRQTSWKYCLFNAALKQRSSECLPYLGAGIRACAAKRKSSMMKEQTRLELNISSLIWENWTKRRTQPPLRSAWHKTNSSPSCRTSSGSPFPRCGRPWRPGWTWWCAPCACARCFAPQWRVWCACWSPWRWTAKCWAASRL